MINVTLPPLYPRKEIRYTLNRRLGGAQRPFGRLVEQNNLLPLSVFKPRIIQPVAYWFF